MKYSKSCVEGFRNYEEHRIVDDMNDSGSCKLKPLDAMNELVLG